jgi:hypothetical protein
MRLHVAIVGDYMAEIEKALIRQSITTSDLWARSAHYARLTDVTP